MPNWNRNAWRVAAARKRAKQSMCTRCASSQTGAGVRRVLALATCCCACTLLATKRHRWSSAQSGTLCSEKQRTRHPGNMQTRYEKETYMARRARVESGTSLLTKAAHPTRGLGMNEARAVLPPAQPRGRRGIQRFLLVPNFCTWCTVARAREFVLCVALQRRGNGRATPRSESGMGPERCFDAEKGS
jgi:hypothetical protein